MAPPKRSRGAAHSHAPKKHRPNHGRTGLRTVTRTARRDAPEPEQSSESEPDEETAAAPAGPAPMPEGKAYDALLTLLAADAPAPATPATKPAAPAPPSAEHDDAESDGIAGLNVSDGASDSDDGAADSDADGDDEPESALALDPFEKHFNLVSEEYMEAAQQAAAGKWASGERREFDKPAYVRTAQAPPGGPLTAGLAAQHDVGKYTTLKSRVRAQYTAQYPQALKPLEASLLHDMLEYRDVSFPTQKHSNTAYKRLYLTHILNHTFKTRDRVIKNTGKIKSHREEAKNGRARGAEPELRDQGFTRPKALVLLPTRNAAYEAVEMLIRLSGSAQQENRKKFREQFFSAGTPPDTKPADFKAMFKGNSNDFFSIGVKFTRKAVKLYSSFYASDVLVASPIGLAMILEDPNQSKRQSDFLSSIEICVVDHANQIEMQNWDHVATVLKYVNKIPKDAHGADFSRIRMWSINDQARLLRQTLVFAEFLTPSVNSVLSRCSNVAGRVRYRPVVTAQTCIMNSVGLRIKQVFQRFDSPDPQSNFEARFKFFANSALPAFTKQASYDTGLLVYIPSYFDYVRVKAHMKSATKLDFVSIDEYSSQSKVSRARHSFASGKAKMLLYTERKHHFSRYELAGVKNVLIYEPPANPLFYKELLRFVGRSVYKEEADIDLSFVKTMYSQWDAVALERIVGSERAAVLCNSVNELYEFR